MIKQKIVAGIDVGSSKVATIISCAVDGDEDIKIIGASSVPSRGIRKGQIVNIEEASQSVVESVEAAERMAGYHLNKAFVSIGGAHLASQNSTGVVAVAEPEGEINAEDIQRVIEGAKAISLPSSREIIHVVPRFYTVDGQDGIKDAIGMSGVRLEVDTHIVTGSTTAIRNLTRCVSEVVADVEELVATGFASAQSVLTETEKELGVILVDFGGGTTTIMVYIEGAPYYTSVLPIGARNVTNDIAIGLRLSLEAAEKIKIAISSKEKKPVLPAMFESKQAGKPAAVEKEGKEKKENEDEIDLSKLGILEETKKVSRKTLVEGIIRPRLNEIFGMVGVEIKNSSAAGLTPAGLVVSGGGAQTVGLVESAKRTLSMPVRIGVPQRITGLIDDIKTPDFATVIGLVMYGAKKEGKSAPGFSLRSLGKNLPKIPIKGVVGKTIDLIKSFLP